MSGSTKESVDESSLVEIFHQLREGIKDYFPDYDLKQEETYSLDVIKGHRMRLRTYLKHRTTGKSIDLSVQYFKIPKHVPKWITKHDLWHHKDSELKQLQRMITTAGEKYPSKATLHQWYNWLAKQADAKMNSQLDVFKTYNPQERQ